MCPLVVPATYGKVPAEEKFVLCALFLGMVLRLSKTTARLNRLHGWIAEDEHLVVLLPSTLPPPTPPVMPSAYLG